jgi:hypothetical protein
MNIFNIDFTKIQAEKQNVPQGDINVNNGINIQSIDKANMAVAEGKTALNLSFEFKALFKPDIGSVELEGNATLLADDDEAQDILDHWDENEAVPQEHGDQIINALMKKSSVQSILLSREVGLPSPLPFNFSTTQND